MIDTFSQPILTCTVHKGIIEEAKCTFSILHTGPANTMMHLESYRYVIGKPQSLTRGFQKANLIIWVWHSINISLLYPAVIALNICVWCIWPGWACCNVIQKIWIIWSICKWASWWNRVRQTFYLRRRIRRWDHISNSCATFRRPTSRCKTWNICLPFFLHRRLPKFVPSFRLVPPHEWRFSDPIWSWYCVQLYILRICKELQTHELAVKKSRLRIFKFK